MSRLEDLVPHASVRGIEPDGPVSVVSVRWFGADALELPYKDGEGKVANILLYRQDESGLEVGEEGRPWSFDGDGDLFRLVSEAQRIRLAHLYDPILAVHTSVVEPRPHQITAVYEAMLPRQPLRFLLADDPGAGKTIMTGLLLKELLMRGDLHRCLIVCPGSLTEQWQDELAQRFQLPFELLTREGIESARSGNVFSEHNLLICRLDQLSRNEDLQEKLRLTDWDVVVCDEAHKMSASFTQGGVASTGRSTDIAIQGNGFFVVRDGTSQAYTRKGNFTLPPDGSLATQDGLPLQAYPPDTAASITPLTATHGECTCPVSRSISARASESASMSISS